jgi:hypothetical protein
MERSSDTLVGSGSTLMASHLGVVHGNAVFSDHIVTEIFDDVGPKDRFVGANAQIAVCEHLQHPIDMHDMLLPCIRCDEEVVYICKREFRATG